MPPPERPEQGGGRPIGDRATDGGFRWTPRGPIVSDFRQITANFGQSPRMALDLLGITNIKIRNTFILRIKSRKESYDV